MLSAGVLAGAVDYYILSRWQRLQDKNVFTKVRQNEAGFPIWLVADACTACWHREDHGGHAADHRHAAKPSFHFLLQDDLKLGKKLATGGFGTVYRAVLDDGSPEGRQVIVKKVRQQTGRSLNKKAQAAPCQSALPTLQTMKPGTPRLEWQGSCQQGYVKFSGHSEAMQIVKQEPRGPKLMPSMAAACPYFGAVPHPPLCYPSAGPLEQSAGFHQESRSHMQAKEFGEAEVWMNERLMRVAPRSVAEFITAFEEQRPETKRRKSAAPEPLWLVSCSGGHHIRHIAVL